MNKTELVSALAEAHELSKPQIGRLVDDVFGNIEAALKKGDEVRFVNFGSFSVKERAARKARNPATGEEIDVPATRKVVFRPGKELKERVGG
jgi:DNA-binding protein HU-beta